MGWLTDFIRYIAGIPANPMTYESPASRADAPPGSVGSTFLGQANYVVPGGGTPPGGWWEFDFPGSPYGAAGAGGHWNWTPVPGEQVAPYRREMPPALFEDLMVKPWRDLDIYLDQQWGENWSHLAQFGIGLGVGLTYPAAGAAVATWATAGSLVSSYRPAAGGHPGTYYSIGNTMAMPIEALSSAWEKLKQEYWWFRIGNFVAKKALAYGTGNLVARLAGATPHTAVIVGLISLGLSASSDLDFATIEELGTRAIVPSGYGPLGDYFRSGWSDLPVNY